MGGLALLGGCAGQVGQRGYQACRCIGVEDDLSGGGIYVVGERVLGAVSGDVAGDPFLDRRQCCRCGR
jgi:hypothetical protein